MTICGWFEAVHVLCASNYDVWSAYTRMWSVQLLISISERIKSHKATQNEFAFVLHFPAYMKICFDCLLLAHSMLTNFFLRCSSPILCVDFIFEISLFISLLPTEQKNCLREAKLKTCFLTYLLIPMSYAVFDHIFGIYAQSYVYMEVFGINMGFYGDLEIKSCFWSKSCFCSSRTAASFPDQTDPGFWFAAVESTPDWLESCFLFWSRF